MHEISTSTENNWLLRTLDGLDILRDSVSNGCAVAEQMRQESLISNDVLLQAAAEVLIAFADYFQNNLQQAVSSFKRLSATFHQLDSPEGVFLANTGLVIVYRKLGEVKLASEFAEQNLIPKLDSVSSRVLILALNIVAILCQERGETLSAIRFFYRALDEARKIDSASRIAQVAANLGEVIYVTGNPSDAEEFFADRL